MCSAKDRIKTYLKVSIEEINLIEKMSAGIKVSTRFRAEYHRYDSVQSLWNEYSICY